MFTQDRLEKMAKQDLVSLVMLLQSAGLKPMDTDEVETPKGTEVIQDYTWHSNHGDKIIKIDGKKFKIYCEYSNGSPLGFNYKKSASVMNESGSWDYVAEGKDFGFDNQGCSYVSDKATCMRTAKRFCDEMQEYLEKIYA